VCGRFTLTADPQALRQAFPFLHLPESQAQQIPPRYNIAPTQPVAVIANNRADYLDFFVWGLIPSWAKDPSIGSRMINARAETLAEKPSFRTALKRRRCLIPADGFYEWRTEGKIKAPMYIRLASGQPFALAGLWDNWHAPDGSEIRSCTIITGRPNALVAPIHDRMPIILPPDAYDLWLAAAEQDPRDLLPLLQPFDPAQMEAYPVDRRVNSPAQDSPACIQPLAAE
jgi:putative SOS response-associated peptidase YedK